MTEYSGVETHTGLTDFTTEFEDEVKGHTGTHADAKIRSAIPTETLPILVRFKRPDKGNVNSFQVTSAQRVTLLPDDPNRDSASITASSNILVSHRDMNTDPFAFPLTAGLPLNLNSTQEWFVVCPTATVGAPATINVIIERYGDNV